ncbi:Zinc knuckle CX2CX4HX4C [Penicillium verhagenii]|nr:Zinc knuckle CX2CX4HX4C [Penicillium verhagenii]
MAGTWEEEPAAGTDEEGLQEGLQGGEFVENDETRWGTNDGYDKNDQKNSNACFNCGEEGHTKAECTEPRKLTGACFNCGEEGHSKSECTKPRVFKGECRLCNQEGHPAAECPERPVDICRNCLGEGHIAQDCKKPRFFDLNKVADRTPGEAWDMMKAAGTDLTEFRSALKVYSKAVPKATYVDIEKKMREDNFPLYIIAIKKEIENVHVLIDLQGNLDKEYTVSFFRGPKPPRVSLKDRWPDTPEDNLERLENAGETYDRMIVRCRRCNKLGHTAKTCKEERVEGQRAEVKCSNCDGLGHRVRDCPEPRRVKGGCRNCGSDEHHAKDCPEPRAAPPDTECRRCNELGHFAKDCPKYADAGPRTCRNCGSEDHIARECDQPHDPKTMTCRNCDEKGHAARDCPIPKDWTKVICNRCGKNGHTVTRCPQAEPEESGGGDFGGGGFDDSRGSFGSHDDEAPAAAGEFSEDRDLADQAW